MRLITQNLLVCNKRTCQAPGVINFPLRLIVNSWNDYDDDNTMPCTRPLMAKLSEKLEWGALRQTVGEVSCKIGSLAFADSDFAVFRSLAGLGRQPARDFRRIHARRPTDAHRPSPPSAEETSSRGTAHLPTLRTRLRNQGRHPQHASQRRRGLIYIDVGHLPAPVPFN